MTDDDYDALSQKQLASIKRDMRISLEDAAVRATYKVMAELETEQEPVAWADHGVVNWIADKQFKHASLLYTTPPQRTWVGLTDDDEIPWDGVDAKSFAKAIEAKLKEKNG